MNGWTWQTVALVWVGALIAIGLPWIIRFFTEKSCKVCAFPLSKCECRPACDHDDQYPMIWSQDGWIAKCKTCGDIVYLGDD